MKSASKTLNVVMNHHHRGKLTKLERKADAVGREWAPTGTSYTGHFDDLPQSGVPFWIYPTWSTYFHTSLVLNVVNDENGHYIIETLNSRYKLEILK